MKTTEFERWLDNAPTVEPDLCEIEAIKQFENDKDKKVVSVSELECSGKLLLRMPKSLHKELREKALAEGVSLNQYVLYKLAH
jgi:predicted HicB family RNase H-like nuclease